jgi:hypothetical protein
MLLCLHSVERAAMIRRERPRCREEFLLTRTVTFHAPLTSMPSTIAYLIGDPPKHKRRRVGFEGLNASISSDEATRTRS